MGMDVDANSVCVCLGWCSLRRGDGEMMIYGWIDGYMDMAFNWMEDNTESNFLKATPILVSHMTVSLSCPFLKPFLILFLASFFFF